MPLILQTAPETLAQGSDGSANDTEEARHALSVPMGDLAKAIQDALADARQYNDQPPYFLVKRIVLELQVVRRQEAEGGVKFEIPLLPMEVSAGAEAAVETTEVLNMTLKPAPQTLVGAAEEINLSALMRAVKAALPSQAGSGGLSLTELSYATRFNLQTAAGGGIDLALAKVGAETSEVTSQKVEFQLCQTVDLLDCVE